MLEEDFEQKLAEVLFDSVVFYAFEKDEIEKQTTISTKDIMLIDGANLEGDDENIVEQDANLAYENQKTSNFKDGQEVKIAGIVTSIKKKFTKTNKIMAFVSIEDLYGTAEVIVFEKYILHSFTF